MSRSAQDEVVCFCLGMSEDVEGRATATRGAVDTERRRQAAGRRGGQRGWWPNYEGSWMPGQQRATEDELGRDTI